MTKKILKLGLLGVAVAATSALTSLQLFGQARVQYAENIPLSYTMTYRNDLSLAPDQLASEEALIRGGRRGDGSTVRIHYRTAADGTPIESRNVFDLSQGRYMVLNSTVNSVTTSGLGDRAIENRRSRRPACDGQVVSNVLGYDVILRTGTAPVEIPAAAKHGRMRVETLIAPALGCLEMETRTIMTYHDGSERVVRSERVVDVRIGEPNAAWFNVPPGYVEMSPAERVTAMGRNVDPASDEVLSHFEQVYDLSRVR